MKSNKNLLKFIEELKPNKNFIECYYTGGGIFLCQYDFTYKNNQYYFIVDNTLDNCISLYKYNQDDELCMPEDMIDSVDMIGELNKQNSHREVYRSIYELMYKKLYEYIEKE